MAEETISELVKRQVDTYLNSEKFLSDVNLNAVTASQVKSTIEDFIKSEQFKNDVQLNSIATNEANRTVKNYIESKEFKDSATSLYKAQIVSVVENAEKRARSWALIIFVLISAIGLSLIWNELLKVKEKRFAVEEEYNHVLKTAADLNKTVDAINSDVDKLKTNVDNKEKEINATLNSLDTEVKRMQAQIATIEKK